ncbi:hypothetical protein A6770_38885 [Nostoc minutum NIES-26]|uniref:Uncharacterized protein n=1 Tax=Nostoc minutum NIES-26 TaxID=1844469 RepID=A0A367RV61_9NOSO|nr:hypothetical protein A6770_38885 [Nostoc minutum NIES-26]
MHKALMYFACESASIQRTMHKALNASARPYATEGKMLLKLQGKKLSSNVSDFGCDNEVISRFSAANAA